MRRRRTRGAKPHAIESGQPSHVSEARGSLARTIAGGADAYDRGRHLPRILPIDPAELVDESEAARRGIVARLARAMRAERTRGRAGHWTYDLNRHVVLRQAYVAERQALNSLARSGSAGRRPASAPDKSGADSP
jgi:hypothetical protein